MLCLMSQQFTDIGNFFSGWTTERVQEYFVWACEVVKGLRGTNSALEQKLDELLRQRGIQL